MNINNVRQNGYLEQLKQNKRREKELDFQKDFLQQLSHAESDDVKVCGPESEENSVINQTWEEAFAEFYDFVEERIKNGPPKIQTGSGAWSVDEWNELIDKIDEDIDTVKKELKERIEKQKEEAEEKQSVKSL